MKITKPTFKSRWVLVWLNQLLTSQFSCCFWVDYQPLKYCTQTQLDNTVGLFSAMKTGWVETLELSDGTQLSGGLSGGVLVISSESPDTFDSAVSERLNPACSHLSTSRPDCPTNVGTDGKRFIHGTHDILNLSTVQSWSNDRRSGTRALSIIPR